LAAEIIANMKSKQDRYSLIKGTNTQTRNLYLALNVLKIIGNSSFPMPFLKEKVLKWDKDEKIISTWYRDHNGELTNLSFAYYIDLLKDFGFITQIGEVVRSSRNGQLYLFLNENQEKHNRLKDWEKIFILYFLLQKDSDYIICLLDLIADNEDEITEKYIRQKINNDLIKRLGAKRDFLPTKAKDEANQKIRELAIIVPEKKHINKHAVPVRLEWLVDLGILKRSKKKYQLSLKGKHFYESLITFNQNEKTYSDITEDWFNNQFFKAVCLLTNVNSAIGTNKYLFEIKKYLLDFFNKFSTDGAYRIHVENTSLYLIISLIRDENIYLELNDINELFEKGITTNGLLFIEKQGGRKNESYINIKFL